MVHGFVNFVRNKKRKDNSLKVDGNTKNRQKKLFVNGKEREKICVRENMRTSNDCMRGNNSE